MVVRIVVFYKHTLMLVVKYNRCVIETEYSMYVYTYIEQLQRPDKVALYNKV